MGGAMYELAIIYLFIYIYIYIIYNIHFLFDPPK